MDQSELNKMSEEIAKLMADKLGAKGRGLKAKLRHSGRLLPRHVRDAAGVVLEAQRKMGNPKLMKQVDAVALGHAKHACISYLNDIDRTAATRRAVADYFSGLALNILLLAVLILAVLVWRGFL